MTGDVESYMLYKEMDQMGVETHPDAAWDGDDDELIAGERSSLGN